MSAGPRAAASLAPLLLGVALATASAAGDVFRRTESRADCAAYDPLRRPFFGDLHVHTTLSFDAWGQGTRNTPADAYRFARGEPVGVQPYASSGRPRRTLQLRRPLDFAAVTDHAELLGETELCRGGVTPAARSLVCRIARRWPRLGYMIVNSQTYTDAAARYGFCGAGGEVCRREASLAWRRIQEAAEAAYDRGPGCRFTTFVGFEWSADRHGMIHRNVIFRNATVPDRPPDSIDEPDEEALWSSLEARCLEAHNGCDALAIPHNSNLSNGRMFRTTQADGARLTREQALRRAALEPLVEVAQHKGVSECRPGESDAACAFEVLPFAELSQAAGRWLWKPVPPGAYVREALLEGLRFEAVAGANPFRFGLVGSSDTHLGTPGLVDEDRFVGHAAGLVSARLEIPPLPDDLHFNPGGLAVVWAEENSRDALFAAMRRREVYATSGPRLGVRFFGGWELPEGLCDRRDFAARGYAAGVPMGGVLAPPSRGRPERGPAFVVRASRDPGVGGQPGTLLQRVQIVKGWVDEAGKRRERVFDVAGGQTTASATPAADVDLASCTPRGPGFDLLCAVWRDPDWDFARPALYYARVLENPSCRWSTRACLARGVDCRSAGALPEGLAGCCREDLPATLQERAWTSPIWYAPQSAAGR